MTLCRNMSIAPASAQLPRPQVGDIPRHDLDDFRSSKAKQRPCFVDHLEIFDADASSNFLFWLLLQCPRAIEGCVYPPHPTDSRFWNSAT